MTVAKIGAGNKHPRQFRMSVVRGYFRSFPLLVIAVAPIWQLRAAPGTGEYRLLPFKRSRGNRRRVIPKTIAQETLSSSDL
jgi:hypothetical protein